MIDLIGRPLDTKKHTEKRRQNMLYAKDYISRKKLARVAQKVLVLLDEEVRFGNAELAPLALSLLGWLSRSG